MRLRLVVPPDVDQPTGGNVYDLAVADALLRGGHGVDLVRCALDDLGDLLAEPWPGPTLVDGLLACRRPQAIAAAPRPVAVLVHMPLAWDGGLDPAQADRLDALEGEALHAADTVIATSQWTADHLRRHHGLGQVAVARPGVDPAEPVSGSDPPLFVHVAAVLPHKDQRGVVAALARIADLPWQARLVGDLDRDPAYADAVRQDVHDAGLADRIALPGRLSRHDAWAGADLALLPSLAESYGLVVVEALARGIPAIVSTGGPAEALGVDADGNRPGIVVAPGDADALAAALRHWHTTPILRTDLRARAASRRATLHGWNETARQVQAALNAS